MRTLQWQLILDSDVDGGNVRDTLKMLSRKITNPSLTVGGVVVSLNPPDDDLGDYAEWAYGTLMVFYELSRQRTRSQGGANPIQFSEVEAYSRLNSITLSALDVGNILMLDGTFMKEASRQLQAAIDKT